MVLWAIGGFDQLPGDNKKSLIHSLIRGFIYIFYKHAIAFHIAF